ncbi:hypothetical protein BDV93DRAFT_596291 [Ceratobasidium sp. AG-I]|nr:hypothetical protein BDV93DRAFT_596291 [Ceratobasidium sp. AG-I]
MVVQRLVQHPGFGVLLRVLADERFRDVLLGVVETGVRGMGNGLMLHQLQAGESYFARCLLRTLRIISRALETQDAFIELLVPASRQLLLDVEVLSVVPTLDWMLLWRPDAVVQVASLINYQDSEEVVLLSVKLLTALLSCFNSLFFPFRGYCEQGWQGKHNIICHSRETLSDHASIASKGGQWELPQMREHAWALRRLNTGFPRRPAGHPRETCSARARTQHPEPGFPGFSRVGCPEFPGPGYPADILTTVYQLSDTQEHGK